MNLRNVFAVAAAAVVSFGLAGAAVLASAVAAGIMASSKGRPTLTPSPRRTVRRVRCFFVMNMFCP